MSQQYKQLPLHNSICNNVYYELQDCQKENPFRKFLGECTSFEKKVQKCIKANLEYKRENNAKLAKKSQEKMKQLATEQ